MRRTLPTLFLLTFALGVSLVLGELLLRGFLYEIDFLRPVLRPHPVLGHGIVPGSGGTILGLPQPRGARPRQRRRDR